MTPEDEAKLTKRKERFGSSDVSVKSDSKVSVSVEVKKDKRAARFGGGAIITGPDFEEKKKARAARFGGGT